MFRKGQKPDFTFYLEKHKGLEEKAITDGWTDKQIHEVYDF